RRGVTPRAGLAGASGIAAAASVAAPATSAASIRLRGAKRGILATPACILSDPCAGPDSPFSFPSCAGLDTQGRAPISGLNYRLSWLKRSQQGPGFEGNYGRQEEASRRHHPQIAGPDRNAHA